MKTMAFLDKPRALRRLPLEARVLYSGFCLFMLIGVASSVWFYADDDLGVQPRDTVAYYLGDAAAAKDGGEAEGEGGGGPALDLPDELGAALPTTEPGEGLRFEKPPRQIMETFHFHLFTVPVCLLIVGHLFMMCGLRSRTKVWILGLTSGITLLHILVPPLVRFADSGFAVLMFPSALGMLVLWTLVTAWPLWDMWRPANEGDEAGG